MRRVVTMAAGLATALLFAGAAQGATDGPRVVVVDGGTVPGTAKHIKLLGHDPLFARGMNAAPAVLNDSGYLYVGSRTDGAPDHPNAGILVVDASDPSDPEVVNEIGPPFAANPSETTRELRIWQDKKILIVLTFTCSAVIHHCEGSVAPNFRFFDLSDPANPEFMMNFVPRRRTGRSARRTSSSSGSILRIPTVLTSGRRRRPGRETRPTRISPSGTSARSRVGSARD